MKIVKMCAGTFSDLLFSYNANVLAQSVIVPYLFIAMIRSSRAVDVKWMMSAILLE